MTWVVHALVYSGGTLDLRYTDRSASPYLVDDSSGDPAPNTTDEYVANSGSDGARLAYAKEAETPLPLNVICIGDTKAEAKANRTLLRTILLEARNHRDDPTVVYEFQESDSEDEPESWFVIGGRVRDVRSFPGRTGRAFAVDGRPAVLASVTLALTKS